MIEIFKRKVKNEEKTIFEVHIPHNLFFDEPENIYKNIERGLIKEIIEDNKEAVLKDFKTRITDITKNLTENTEKEIIIEGLSALLRKD